MPKYLIKASDDVISFCRCEFALAAGPSQLDCPWCGCGWLFSCLNCGKAFTFARVIDVDLSYNEIARRDAKHRGLKVSDDEVRAQVAWTASEMDRLTLGDVVVYLDGVYLPLDEAPVSLDGEFATHELGMLPHALALQANPDALRTTLGDVDYWLERERPERGHEG